MDNKNDNKNDTAQSVFLKLQKKFNLMKVKEEEEKKLANQTEKLENFERTMKNFENNLYNDKLYGATFPMKEVILDATYSVTDDMTEYIYMEYFIIKYPYSDISVKKVNNGSQIKIILLDDDRERFLAKYNIRVEERQIPENYFVSLK